ncbi:DUF4175 family protein [Pedobacter sp. Hv1]|uniref:DUF4175 family protein n=1 Tax=Pedobacter sp. Hv1 TaxID=1740090 RepID=UPI0006D8BDF2|nr:DUF4175 family protein [Pedobacter sp. Hv1]KQC01277.1 hypothetical protein AQF98_11530 [Pedobacter sp. Hv1]
MSKAEGEKWIQQLRVKWISLYWLQGALLNLAISIVLMVVATRFLSFSYWILLPLLVLVAAVQLWFKPIWKITTLDIARHLNTKYAVLEESTALFLKPETEIALLEHLQIEKISAYFPITDSLNGLWRKIGYSLIVLMCSIGLSLLINRLPYSFVEDQLNTTTAASAVVKEHIPAQLQSFKVSITPPVYTRNKERTQKQLTIKVEANAKVDWKFETNTSLKSLKMIFNDKEVHQLKPSNADSTVWSFSRTITQPGFYQLVLDGQKSDLYQIEVIPDLPVQIKIIQPKQRTVIDIGQPQKVNLNINLTDDYGIKDAFISVTMASGKGEGVSFTEKKLSFNTSFNNQQEIKLQQLLELKTLGMKPGDELYFFVQALDNHGQVSRSDVYFVSIVDPTELMSMAGMTNGVDLVPEYFRSQRQIIIDTEKLLKEQESLSTEEFKNRSNALGIDQKLLRLRYGKFLGEEAETEIGGDHDHDDDHGKGEPEAKFGDVQAIMDKYAHKHDIAEDATFFEPELKAQLKAVLTEMWSSELQLRTYKPQGALPFEYKALRLLKDLQQKSRAYVAKTTVKTTTLKPEKRLSGELGKIISPLQQADFEKKDQTTENLKTLLSLLESRKTGNSFNAADRQLLHEAEGQLIGAAANQPGIYLAALKSLRKMSIASKVNLKDIELVQQVVQKLIGQETAKPQTQNVGAANNLSKTYFNYLKKQSR